MIKVENGEYKYYDRNGKEITDGCKIRYENGRIEEVYMGETGQLGTDATNPVWLKKGWACPCEYGIYPLTNADTEEVEVIEE